MKLKPILTAFAVAVAALAQPGLAGFTQNEKGEVTHYNGIPLPPIQTVEEAKAQAQKEIAAAQKAREAEQAEPATRHSLPATPPQEVFFTGKPYLEETGQYLFLFRHYDPELARWSIADPSGFPDGANNWHYVANMVTLAIDPDGLQFLHFNGSSITVWSGSGRRSDGSIDWGTSGTSWSAVSGGSGGAASIPNGWWQTTGFMSLGVVEERYFPERSLREGDILFAGTMSSWDTTSGPGYGDYAFQAYGGITRFGYDTTTAGGTAPNIIEYKVGLRGIHGNPISIHKGHRIHPTMAESTSGCIGVRGHEGCREFPNIHRQQYGHCPPCRVKKMSGICFLRELTFLLAFGVFLSPSYAVAAEVALITLDPQSGSSIEKMVNASDVPLESAQNLVEVINILFLARSEKWEDYYKYFGVEPESPSSIGVDAGKSAFLADCRIVLGEDWGKATLSILAAPSAVWKLDSNGDYVTYAVRVVVKNSQRFRFGILQFRTETIKPTHKNKPIEVSFRPSRLYLGR